MDAGWLGVVSGVLRLPPRRKVHVEKATVPHPSASGFDRHRGLPKRQIADYRMALPDGRGIHVLEYDGRYAVHWDERDPRLDLWGHLVRDAPGVILLAGVLVAGLLLGAGLGFA